MCGVETKAASPAARQDPAEFWSGVQWIGRCYHHFTSCMRHRTEAWLPCPAKSMEWQQEWTEKPASPWSVPRWTWPCRMKPSFGKRSQTRHTYYLFLPVERGPVSHSSRRVQTEQLSWWYRSLVGLLQFVSWTLGPTQHDAFENLFRVPSVSSFHVLLFAHNSSKYNTIVTVY